MAITPLPMGLIVENPPVINGKPPNEIAPVAVVYDTEAMLR